MRFIENGPSVPDALLNARDEGSVVFFCGAGVSQARAGLPNFFGLAEAVLQELGASSKSDARKLLDAAAIGNKLNIAGLISADRVFGLLEREFTVLDIQAAVAKCLTPKSAADVSAHELLVRLAATGCAGSEMIRGRTRISGLFFAAAIDLFSAIPCSPRSGLQSGSLCALLRRRAGRKISLHPLIQPRAGCECPFRS